MTTRGLTKFRANLSQKPRSDSRSEQASRARLLRRSSSPQSTSMIRRRDIYKTVRFCPVAVSTKTRG